ncbi:uncharacterized protein LACBIDRAFT_335426 [Laccaria bicolor S238N-H82]|uniref:Predicted protein n=1 Tax=Laccaria bicolor (strain S238N-H82 / ATCC MYA-4686) TaxID=486041 RepID=B0E2A9_LACBS|nr:uncharacterized protein LACBIDRAFT_335426 [Laccaria bicolor S238N-H82]EDQ99015.1 predicted protein [Laccaria bicolor S238N-H82]|eukprot:XP_001890323.1 predicted protein [Laccaria bicolor S238N-H82]
MACLWSIYVVNVSLSSSYLAKWKHKSKPRQRKRLVFTHLAPSTKALKGLLQGAASISWNKTYAKPKTYAKLWKVLYITEGSIVTIAILAKAGTPYHKALLKFYNDIIFKAQMDNNTVALINDDDSSSLEEAFTRLTLTPSTSTPGQASHSGAHAERRADSTINTAGSMSHQPQSMMAGPSQPIVQEVARPANTKKGKKARAPAKGSATVTAATEMAVGVAAAAEMAAALLFRVHRVSVKTYSTVPRLPGPDLFKCAFLSPICFWNGHASTHVRVSVSLNTLDSAGSANSVLLIELNFGPIQRIVEGEARMWWSKDWD